MYIATFSSAFAMNAGSFQASLSQAPKRRPGTFRLLQTAHCWQPQPSSRSLGKLTQLNLSVNRKAQNSCFMEKRDLLIANTNLRLNVPLVSQTVWGEASIAERGRQLTEVALTLWPGPRA